MNQCPNFKKCGGCQYLDMPYEEQLKKKHKEVSQLLKPFCKVNPVVGMEDPFHYRNKIEYAVARQGRLGFAKAGSHEIVPAAECPLAEECAAGRREK